MIKRLLNKRLPMYSIFLIFGLIIFTCIGFVHLAINIGYDNTVSELESDNVQGAIDELAATQPHIQISQAYRCNWIGYCDYNQIYVLQGEESAFRLVDDVMGPIGEWNEYDGIECDRHNGWHLMGCWTGVGGNNEDVSPYENGCITNDFDQKNEVALSISCIKYE